MYFFIANGIICLLTMFLQYEILCRIIDVGLCITMITVLLVAIK
jgi:hypothetical protein